MSDVPLHQIACRTNDCSKCGAKAGHSCVTSTGRLATMVHVARTRPVYTAWADGYAEGFDDVLDAVIDNAPWIADRLASRRTARGL